MLYASLRNGVIASRAFARLKNKIADAEKKYEEEVAELKHDLMIEVDAAHTKFDSEKESLIERLVSSIFTTK